jgi:hypothetical protein
LREEYQKILISIEKNGIIYLDESGFDMNMRKEFMITNLATEKARESR